MGFPYKQICGEELISDHGAKFQRFTKEILVNMVGDVGSEDEVTLENVIPAGAFDVWVTGRVVEAIVTDQVPDPTATFKLGYNTAEASPQDNSDAYYGSEILLLAGTTWGPAAEYDSGAMTYSGGMDTTYSNSGPRIWWPTGGHLYFNSAGGAFVSGQVRLVIFYSLMTPPTS